MFQVQAAPVSVVAQSRLLAEQAVEARALPLTQGSQPSAALSPDKLSWKMELQVAEQGSVQVHSSLPQQSTRLESREMFK